MDVGEYTAMAMVADGDGKRLIAPFTFRWTVPGLLELVARVRRVVPDEGVVVVVGVEAAGHYHRPLTCSGLLPSGWDLIELELGLGLWLNDPATRSHYITRLKARGKPSGIIACELARQASKIAIPTWAVTSSPTSPSGGGTDFTTRLARAILDVGGRTRRR